MAKDKLLLISCYFPPAGGIQVQRALSLARYLPQNGFEVHVLAARNASVPTVDPELTKLIPPEVHVHRTLTLEPPFHWRKKLWSRVSSASGPQSWGKSSGKPSGGGPLRKAKAFLTRRVTRLLCPDPQVLWYPFALRRASRLIRKEGIQTVVVTAPPFSAFRILIALKRRFPRLHMIADIRDEWLRYFVKEFAFRDDGYVLDRAAQIERETVACCDRVVAVTTAALLEMRGRYPGEPQDKFVLIPNGYDPASFANFKPRPHRSGKLVVTYTGTVYKPCSPKIYLDALDTLPDAIRSQFETRFIGRIAEEFDRSIFAGRGSSLELLGFLPQHEAIRFMEESDVLLLPWTDRLNIPGKLFEYLVTGRPILALAHPASDVERVIHETASGWCVDPDDPAAVARVLSEIHAAGGRFPRERNWTAIRRYERPRLAAEYADTIRDCFAPRKEIPSYAQ